MPVSVVIPCLGERDAVEETVRGVSPGTKVRRPGGRRRCRPDGTVRYYGTVLDQAVVSPSSKPLENTMWDAPSRTYTRRSEVVSWVPATTSG